MRVYVIESHTGRAWYPVAGIMHMALHRRDLADILQMRRIAYPHCKHRIRAYQRCLRP